MYEEIKDNIAMNEIHVTCNSEKGQTNNDNSIINLFFEDVSNKVLQSITNQFNMSNEERIHAVTEYMNKKKKLSEVIDLSNMKIRKDDNRYYIYINRKQIIANSELELIDKLYEMYFGSLSSSLSDLFSEWMIYRRDVMNTCSKTLKENASLWKSMYSNTDIVNVPIAKLTVNDWISFFRSQTGNGIITRKRFNDGKSILNGIYYYAIEQGIIENNLLKNINYKSFKYKPENNDVQPFTTDERVALIDYFISEGDVYSLAIAFDFCLVARIGELKGLRWSDISSDGSYIRIQKQVNEFRTMNNNCSFSSVKYCVNEAIKGRTSAGFRNIPLTDTSKKILEMLKVINSSNEYIFMNGDSFMTTVTFNRHLKKACEFLNIEYRSSHKIRFTEASLLFKKNVSMTTIQKMLGHSNLAMTIHYLKSIENDTAEIQTIMNTLN